MNFSPCFKILSQMKLLLPIQVTCNSLQPSFTAHCLALYTVYSSTRVKCPHYCGYVQILRGHNVVCLQFKSPQIPGFTGQEHFHVHRIGMLNCHLLLSFHCDFPVYSEGNVYKN